MVDNIYHEARGEDYYGQLLVALVVINRSNVSGKSLCSVIHQHRQFSWTLLPATRKAVPQNLAQERARLVALHALAAREGARQGRNLRAALGATWGHPGLQFYHHKAIKPVWRKKLRKSIVHGSHVFYIKEK